MLGISKLLISLSCPASWSLYNNHHFVTLLPDTKCILHAKIQICQAVSLHLLCNAKKVALGFRSGREGLSIFQTGSDSKQDLASEKIPFLRAPDQSTAPPQASARGLLPSRLLRALNAWRGLVLCPLIATACVSFKRPYEASVCMINLFPYFSWFEL